MIRKLPPELVREIAAGEVIASPADVLKELIENALDAKATRLEIETEGGGGDKIVVKDNGVGIAKDELPLAVEAHSTSKLESLTSITTLGFRGEGLYALRHSARLELRSRPREQLGGATLVAQGEELSVREHPAPVGTTAEVSKLFSRLPARRAALETPAAENRKLLALVGRYLLHHPGLQLHLVMDGEEKWLHAGGDVMEVVKLLWGVVSANRLLRLEARAGAMTLRGLISRPELVRPRRDRLLLAVNGRPVEWPEALLKAILQAYLELLPKGQFPLGVLNLALDPETVLVNTSPEKSRVRLLTEGTVASFVQKAVEETLSLHPLARALPEPQPLEGVTAAPRSVFPKLRYLGAFRELYLLAESEDQLWLVDQHAAHERILYEELQRRYRQEAPVELPQPELIHLSLEEAARYLERAPALAAIGLSLEPFGGQTWRVRRLPAFLLGHPDLTGDVVKGVLGYGDVQEAWRAVLARLACLPAIRAGHSLSGGDAQALLDALRDCATPWVCPHSRPTALVLAELEVARRFGRRNVRAVQPVRR
jgi:DNA mismatch repair protein MutL